jgi:hypothetical protein
LPDRNGNGLKAVALLAYGLALLLPPSSPFAALALPALLGERIARRRARLGVLVGALVAGAYITVLALLVPLCGLGDAAEPACDRMGDAAMSVTWWVATVTVVLAALATAWPRRRALRYALWSMPALMVATFAIIAFVV